MPFPLPHTHVIAVIVTFNRLELLKLLIGSLRVQTRRPDAIIVVNNGSLDGTRDWLDMQPDLQVEHQSNVGCAGGLNTGIRRGLLSSPEWVWLMDDDIVPASDCLEQLLTAAAERQPAPISVVPIRLSLEGRRARDEGQLDTRFFSPNWRRLLSSEVTRIERFTFEGPLVLAKVFGKVGLPEAGYFLLFDDYDFALRIARAGPVELVENARIIRQLPKDWNNNGTQSPIKSYFRFRNNIYFIRRHFGASQWIKLYEPLRQFLKVYRRVGRHLPSEQARHYRQVMRRALCDGFAMRLGLPEGGLASLAFPSKPAAQSATSVTMS